MDNNFTQITQYKFFCEKCDFKSNKKNDFNRHLLTAKHLKITMDNNFTHFTDKKFKCECSKEFKFNSGLSKHKKTCNFLKINNTDLIQIESNKQITELKEDNKELKIMIKELIKENAKQQQQIGELIPKIGNTTNNNTQNNKFNIQVFLNEKCKDAINMTDFVK